MVVGLYFDGSTSNWKCYENVVVGQSYGAVSGEADELYEEGDDYIVGLRKRRTGTTLIYLQHISSQITHNILCDSNWIVNVRATEADKQKLEVYKTYVVATRNLIAQNTRYTNGCDPIPGGAEDIIYSAGCLDHPGDPSLLWNNDY
jgi:hypothetical protein